jgi:hypothetical protein
MAMVSGLTPATHKFVVYGKRVSAIRVMTNVGIEDAYLVEGNVNGDTLQFIQRSLLNIVQPFNGSNPKSVVVIEEVFSQIKSYIRDNKIIYQTTSEPRLIIVSAFASITTQDCQNYIQHAGYIE